MAAVDEEREKPVFSQRLREEWEDAIVKRYIFKEQGDMGGNLLTHEEIKQALANNNGSGYDEMIGDGYVGRYEQMRL